MCRRGWHCRLEPIIKEMETPEFLEVRAVWHKAGSDGGRQLWHPAGCAQSTQRVSVCVRFLCRQSAGLEPLM